MALALACRFVPYDQWFATHVDPGWHVKDVKLWFLQKCLQDISLIDPPRRRTSRTPSPIVFASDSKRRPVSPILFAPPDHSEQEPEHPPDDKERTQPARTEQPAPIPSAYDPEKLSLIRFSTGQVLEDDFLLEWYDIKPYELLEVHRSGIILRLPRNHIQDYIQPYWEGWVKALRVVFRPPVPNDPISSNRTRTSIASRQTAHLEWRKRWVVIHRGVLSMCKDRTDANPSHVLDLSSLVALRDAEHLRRSTSIVPTADQRIICAKFLTRPKTIAPIPVEDVQRTTITTITANNPSSTLKPKTRLKIKPPLSLPLSKRRPVPSGTGSHPGSFTTKIDSPTRGERRLKGKEAANNQTDEDVPDISLAHEGQEEAVASKTQDMHSDTESVIGSDVSSDLSSPVFAHRVDGYRSDDIVLTSEDENYRPGYTYGYRYDTSVAAKSREKKAEPVYDQETWSKDKPEAGTDSNSGKRRRRKDHGEWVVLDMGDDNAFSSILRVLHRQCTQPLTSTFTALLPSVAASPSDQSEHDKNESTAQPNENVQSEPTETPAPQLNRLPPTLLQTNFTANSFHTQQDPMSLSVAHKLSAAFGALPYPEWRTNMTQQARRAGIGKIGTPMEMFLFGTTIPLPTPRGRKRHTREVAKRSPAQRNGSACDSDSGEESSEVEWLGWLGDLPRQVQLSKQRDEVYHDFRDDWEVKPSNLLSETQLEDQRRFLEDRRAFEPSAVVTSLSKRPLAYPMAPQPSPSSPHFADPFDQSPGMSSPVDTHSTSPSSPTHSRSHSQLDDWSGPSRADNDLMPLRRPSMPTILDSSNSALASYTVASATGSGAKYSSQPRSTILSRSASGRSLNSSSLAAFPTISSANTVPRRASMSGLVGQSGGSIGRTTARSPAVLKKDSEQRKKQEGSGEFASRRPRLSVSTSSPANPSLGSFRATSPTSRSNLRPVPSNLSLRSGTDSEDREGVKKRKGGLVRGVSERLVRGLDSALDFVDGR